MRITTAVIPAAGFGTRFLPATKAQPKEMLTVVDKPVIQYVVEDAVAAGIENIIIITGQSKRAIEDHFDRGFELETRLREQGKLGVLKEVRRISGLANFIYIRQKELLGDGHAILEARSLLRNEPFAVLFGDTLTTSCTKELVTLYEEFRAPIVAVVQVPKRDVSHYGVIGGVKLRRNVHQITTMVEKPRPATAPSNLAALGQYVVTPELLETLRRMPRRRGHELRLADAILRYVAKHPAYAYTYTGTHYDCGNKLGLLKATVTFALEHPDLKRDFAQFLKAMV